ncbi:hypothetical protein ABZV91_07755 [Nocardia sp. NPDC004568]|uniref:hypothetical protein n=1 Tax=Nocardia sp. NPDC004568 TaxID=3154551 RepID=UPI0033A4675D
MPTSAPVLRPQSDPAFTEKLAADFLVTREGQTALSTGCAAALSDIEGAVARAHDVPYPDTAALIPDAVTRYQQTWQGISQR